MTPPPRTESKTQLLWHYIQQHSLSYGVGVLAIIATNWMVVSIPQYLQKSIDALGVIEEQNRISEYVGIMLLLTVGMIVVRTSSRILFFNPGRAIECQLKDDMLGHLLGLQKDYYDKNPTGNIISRINNDITGVRMICGFGMMQTFNIISALSLTPFKMWQLSPRLTLYCIIPIILVFTVVRIGMQFLVQNMRQRMKDLQDLSGFTVSSLSGIDVIKTYAMMDWSTERFNQENLNLMERSLSISWVRSFIMPLLNNLENVLKVMILLFGGMLVIEEQFTIGELTAFISYAALLTMPLMALGWVTTMIQRGLVGVASVQTILNQPVPFEDRERLPESDASHLFDHGITVNNLSHSYSNSDGTALENISFSIKPGQIIGVLGKVGSGKTTLLNCLNRYLNVESGQIIFGKYDINDLHYSDLRHCIRTVSQEPFLFSDTVQSNIAFGAEKEDDEINFEQIFHESALTDEVQSFPAQEQTMVGEKGIMLSGGQKQRISLARALTRPCDLLVLDNALSAVDYETERFLLKQIFERKQCQSLLIVSHRITFMEQADWILVLDEGKVVSQGLHKDLIQHEGYYQEMWELQNEEG